MTILKTVRFMILASSKIYQTVLQPGYHRMISERSFPATLESFQHNLLSFALRSLTTMPKNLPCMIVESSWSLIRMRLLSTATRARLFRNPAGQS